MFYVKSPEPIDWSRATIRLSRAERNMKRSTIPGNAKLTNVSRPSRNTLNPDYNQEC